MIQVADLIQNFQPVIAGGQIRLLPQGGDRLRVHPGEKGAFKIIAVHPDMDVILLGQPGVLQKLPKLGDRGIEAVPVAGVNLGVLPIERLRHSPSGHTRFPVVQQQLEQKQGLGCQLFPELDGRAAIVHLKAAKHIDHQSAFTVHLMTSLSTARC